MKCFLLQSKERNFLKVTSILFSHTFRHHILQADSEEALVQWLAAFQAGIDAAYNCNRHPVVKRNTNSSVFLDAGSTDSLSTNASGNSTSGCNGNGSSNNLGSYNTNSTIFTNSSPLNNLQIAVKSDCAKILSIPGNEYCADCGSNEPIWASINLGITLCIECSGVHRSLGVHLSKVRSLKLDELDCEQVSVILGLGNTLINKIYEAKQPPPLVCQCSSEVAEGDQETLNSSIDDSSLVSENSEFYIECSYSKKEGAMDEEAESVSLLTDVRQSLSTSSSALLGSSPKKSEQTVEKPQTLIPPQSQPFMLKINPKSTRAEREKWIRAKYVDKLFVDKSIELNLPLNSTPATTPSSEPPPLPTCPPPDLVDCHHFDFIPSFQSHHQKVLHSLRCYIEFIQRESKTAMETESPPEGDSPAASSPINMIDLYYNLLLYEAALHCDLKVMCLALACDATVNWKNALDKHRTPLFQAIFSNTMTSCEYLLLNGAKCSELDDEGSSALHYATRNANTGQVVRFNHDLYLC